jgi:hypothetical protein
VGFLAGGCSFNFELPSDGGAAPDADPNAPDADPNAPDADPNAPDAADCGWQTAVFDVCQFELPTTSLDLTAASYLYNTTNGQLTDNAGPAIIDHVSYVLDLDPPVRVLLTEEFTLNGGSTMGVIGDKPLIIASRLDLEIQGELNVFSSGILPAAGANPTACASGAAQVGASDTGGSGGGGGGAFQGSGGNGNAGNGGTVAGGVGGTVATIPSSPRGGCAGAAGGSSAEGAGGQGGPGGGAIHLASSVGIDVSGIINAGGAGGLGGGAKAGGGGGGGSGGYIGLDAPTVVVSGAVAANGGGGGGGGEDPQDGGAGENGLASLSPAAGGSFAGAASRGGVGSAGDQLAGETVGASPFKGGGGGGGGAGFIVVWGTFTPSEIVSPAAAVQ